MTRSPQTLQSYDAPRGCPSRLVGGFFINRRVSGTFNSFT